MRSHLYQFGAAADFEGAGPGSQVPTGGSPTVVQPVYDWISKAEGERR